MAGDGIEIALIEEAKTKLIWCSDRKGFGRSGKRYREMIDGTIYEDSHQCIAV